MSALRSSEGLGDSFLCDFFLDSHIELTGESDAGAVDFSQNVLVLLLVVPVKDEVGGPDEGHFLFVEGALDSGQLCQEEIDQGLPLFGAVVGVLGS